MEKWNLAIMFYYSTSITPSNELLLHDMMADDAQCLKPVEKWPKPPKNFLKMDKKKFFIWTYWWTESSKIQFLWLVFFKSMVKIEFENIWHTKLIFWTFPKKILHQTKNYVFWTKFHGFSSFLLHSPHVSSASVMWNYIFGGFVRIMGYFLKICYGMNTFLWLTKSFLQKNFQKLMILHDPMEIFHIQHLHTTL